MTLWLLLLIFSAVLISFGVLLDFIAKKKGFIFQTEEVTNSSSGSELINQVHVNQAIGIGDGGNS
ncbi:hypothetical protein [Neobacillus sp. D3-1R]|uniref:hypothetical protein n=1 Tax=Neobacillus sp. D3-1R TaxID=3445778 RepID=UPI003F9EC578